jgi:RNA polymerase sigma-70 factor (ECF subfamily)
MNETDRQNLFSQLISHHQSELYAYIFAVVRNWEDADDLFQAVSLVLWEKFDVFRPGTNFFFWARKTAEFKIRKFMSQKKTPNYVGEELLDALTEGVSGIQQAGADQGLPALRRCKAKLSAADVELLELRYVDDLGSREIADRLRRPQHSVCHSLKRVRRSLFECIRKELAQQEHAEGGLS